MDVKNVLGFGLLAVGALLLAWLALGLRSSSDAETIQRTAVQVEGLDERTAAWTKRQQAQDLVPIDVADTEVKPPVPLDEDPNIRVVTPYCRQLIGHMRRNVDSSTLLDMIRDGAMRFDDDDLQCLSAAGAKPAIVDMAARAPKY